MNQERLNEIEKPLLHIVKHDVVPALGCTEPISLALASATAAKYLGKTPERIEAKVSPNLMKNGLGVAVPGTGMVGLPIAAAIGALGGDPEGELEVLKHITPEQVSQAKAMLDKKLVNVDIHQTEHILYSEAVLFTDNDRVKVAIQDQHTNIILIEKNGEIIFEKEQDECADCDPYDIFKQVSDDLLSKIMIETTAASDARMGGATLPAMSNSGSGNQGIAATMPVVVVADYLNVSEEKRLRALFLSHLMAIYIHSKLPKLSALCAVTTASMGSCAGIAYLLTGKFETMSMGICSMIGDLSGIICDGASNSCAMKVSTSVASGYKSVLMAMDETHVTGNEGIVEHDLDRTIDNLCAIASKSMQHIDRQVIEIMVSKPCP